MKLEELVAGSQVEGLHAGQVVTVIAAQWHGSDAVELTYRSAEGSPHQQLLFRSDEARLTVAARTGRAFDAVATDFKLVAEAQRISLAGLYDPMLAVSTSDVQPLPHQIRAVYGELLPRTPLRYLLADDPGAGKTIMAGLYIKELMLRDDVKRCLIVAPGGLVEQWQDELRFKFDLRRFELLTNQMIDANLEDDLFESHPLLIARMDQLARSEVLQGQLERSGWDLIIVDEAHRMGAHYFGGKLQKTRRFALGELLGGITRHLLLMTATPHSGKEEDYQLFLTLLDRDRFEGRQSETADTNGLMLRRVKEELLTFEGTRLFPERVAETVPYQLTAAELDLYQDVTRYVREGMNRAERVGGQRKNTIGFALTVLQRRLASSPEAILASLIRRTARLRHKQQQLADGVGSLADDLVVVDDLDPDEFLAEELEDLEEELVDSATAARTAAELEAEILELTELTAVARRVRDLGTDRKWTELSTILQDHALTVDHDGRPRKLIIFTEHRDTLNYLQSRIGSLLGRPEAVRTIHGGVRRPERRQITAEFTHNSDCQILIATDAAGEGLNLQAAHLMVNYDLPWNPNRIEQRFGRIHRIGQREVCRLWNLVAENTREGEVFTRLLTKIEEQRKAYGGKVFDVLGEAFAEVPLRTLLVDAIQYGERPDVRARLNEVIDQSAGSGLKELLDERALAADHLGAMEIAELRAAMDDARARRLQPHYIELAFKAAFARLGGRIVRREQGRYEITHVPAQLRSRHPGPIATRYERVSFDLAYLQPEEMSRAELLAPGHPLHDAVMAEVISQFDDLLEAGTVLVSNEIAEPHLLVGVVEEITDATGDSVARRFGYAFVDRDGAVTPAGPAPYLDCVAAPETAAVTSARNLPWLIDAEVRAVSWIITHQVPEHLAELRERRSIELIKIKDLVAQRLHGESERLLLDSAVAAEREQAGQPVRESSVSLQRKAVDLDHRLRSRLTLLDQQSLLSARSPRLVSTALVLPLSLVENDLPDGVPLHAKETKAVERRGVELVLASERHLGRHPQEMPFNNKGFDILSTGPDGETFRIEVKARIDGAEDFFVTHSEVMTGKNSVPRYRLALVRVDPRGADHDDVRYLDDPFAHTELGSFDATGVRGDWHRTWAKGKPPF